MTQTAFDFLASIPRKTIEHAWTRHDRGEVPFPWYEHTSGWQIIHCGHPTALYRYYAVDPDGATHYSSNGFGWAMLADAKRDLDERFGVVREMEVER